MVSHDRPTQIVAALGATAGLLAALNAITVTLQLALFWFDLLTGLVCCFTATSSFQWLSKTSGFRSRFRALVKTGDGLLKAIVKAGFKSRRELPFFLSGSFFLLLGLFFVSNPVKHLVAGQEWYFCGTFVPECEDGCLYLLDERRRDIFSSCLRFEDDSGYIRVSPKHWWVYKPSFVSVACNGQRVHELPAEPAMFSPACERVWVQ